MKILCLIVMFSLCALGGYRSGRKLKDEADFWRQMAEGLTFLSHGVRVGDKSLGDLLTSMPAGVFRDLGLSVTNGVTPIRAAELVSDRYDLNPVMAAFLRDVFLTIGTGDRHRESERLQALSVRAASAYNEAQNKATAESALRTKAGLLLGATIVIILM